MEVKLNSQAYFNNLMFPTNDELRANLYSEHYTGGYLVFSLDVPSCFLNSIVTTFINLVHNFLRDILGSSKPKVFYQIVTFAIPIEIANQEWLWEHLYT